MQTPLPSFIAKFRKCFFIQKIRFDLNVVILYFLCNRITRKFNFDWYIRSRKASEIRDHAQQLLNAIYKEYKMVTERLASSGTAPTINRKPLHQKNSIA